MEMWAGRGPGATEGANLLARLDELTGLDLNTLQMDKNTLDALAMVESNPVAMDLEPVLFVADHFDPTGSGRNNWGSGTAPIIHPPVVVVLGKLAVVVAADAVDTGDLTAIGSEECPIPPLFWSDDAFEGIDPIVFRIADIAILSRWEPNALGGKVPIPQGGLQGLTGITGIDLKAEGAWFVQGGGGNQGPVAIA